MTAEPKSILLVEDNDDDEQLTLRAIRSVDTPMFIRVVRDGKEAIEALYGGNSPWVPDLILLDLRLPKLSGAAILRRIRSEASTRSLPVVVLTSSDEPNDIIDCYSMGVNSYVRKPVDYEEFVDAVRQLGIYWLSMNLHAVRAP